MKRLVLALLIAAALVAVLQYLLGCNDYLFRLEEWVKSTGNPWIFLGAAGVGCAFALPLSFVYLYAGMAFGVIPGWLLSLGGLIISGTIGYIIGFCVLEERFSEKIRRKFKIDSKNRLYNLNFYVRAIPGIPYWAQNIILGSVHTDFKTYTLSNVCVQGAIALAMNYLGANVGGGDACKYLAFAILILVLVAVNKILGRYCAG